MTRYFLLWIESNVRESHIDLQSSSGDAVTDHYLDIVIRVLIFVSVSGCVPRLRIASRGPKNSYSGGRR